MEYIRVLGPTLTIITGLSTPLSPLFSFSLLLACGSVDTAVCVTADPLIGSSPQSDGVEAVNHDAIAFFLFPFSTAYNDNEQRTRFTTSFITKSALSSPTACCLLPHPSHRCHHTRILWLEPRVPAPHRGVSCTLPLDTLRNRFTSLANVRRHLVFRDQIACTINIHRQPVHSHARIDLRISSESLSTLICSAAAPTLLRDTSASTETLEPTLPCRRSGISLSSLFVYS